MINFIYYPNNEEIPNFLFDVVKSFQKNEEVIGSKNELVSDEVLAKMYNDLCELGFIVEKSKKKEDKIPIPVLFGQNNKITKKFEADGVNRATKTVLEIEAGRGILNNQFLKDYFEACMMIDIEYCVIAVRNTYKGSKDFEHAKLFFDTLYTSNKIKTDLKGLLLIGY